MKNMGLIFMVSIIASLAWGRPYKYYLNPQTAEQVLGSIHLQPRLSQDEWLKLINFDKNEKRIIQTGDNLWNISRSRFGDPFLWRKLWQENSWLTNPHELEVGRILAYYNEEIDGAPIKRIPIVKLRPEKAGAVGDVENDIVINRSLKNRYRLVSLIVAPDDILGELTGAYSNRSDLHLLDRMYAQFADDKRVEPGSRFSVVRFVKELRDRTQPGNPLIGQLANIVGEIEIMNSEQGLTQIEVVRQFERIRRGDSIILTPPISNNNNAEYPARDLIPQIILGEEDAKTFIKQGELVILNKGQNHGMKDGYLFKVFQDMDPVKNSTQGVLPDSKGEVRVVFVGPEYSIGIVNRNKEPLEVGDSLVSFPELPNRPPPPKRKVSEISIE